MSDRGESPAGCVPDRRMEETMADRRATIVSASCLCAASLWLIVVGLPQSGAAEIPEPIRQALELNARSLSPITVAWERTRTSDLPRPRALSLLSQTTNSMFLPQTSRFMWDNGRFYTQVVNQSVEANVEPGGQITEPTDAPPDKTEVEVTFDGHKRSCLSRFGGYQSPPMVLIDTPANLSTHEPYVRFLDGDFFYQAGFHLPEQAEDYVAKRPAISLPLYLVEQGAASSRSVAKRSTG